MRTDRELGVNGSRDSAPHGLVSPKPLAMESNHMHATVMRVAAASLAVIAATGCASTSLNGARRDYYAGSYSKAAAELDDEKPSGKDRVLYYMERGTIRQAAGNYEGSSRDFIEAYDEIDKMTAVSVSEDTASMVINDYAQSYRGAPFERTMIHAFTAKNHLMQSNWENAAVEARRIIESLKPEVRKDYPEDAYSRYMAGFCLSLIGDWSNAALQYRNADALLPYLLIDERTGMITPGTNRTDSTAFPKPQANTHEIVAFVLIGRSPTGAELRNRRRPVLPAGFASFYIDGREAGRSYELADTVDLAFTTKQKDEMREMAKTMARVAAKEAAARSIERDNELLGAIFRAVMIGILEQPDNRRWETLPRSLQVARFPCPEKPGDIEVRFSTSAGVVTRTIHVTDGMTQHDRTHILVVRDTPPVL